MRDLDKQATIAMMAALKPGDKPLVSGDHFTHPSLGRMRVSRVLGWKEGFQFQTKGGKTSMVPIKSLVITAFRMDAKRAERVNLLPFDTKAR